MVLHVFVPFRTEIGQVNFDTEGMHPVTVLPRS